MSKYCVVLLRRSRHNIIWHLVITNGLIMQFLSLNCPNINNGFLPPPDLFMASAGTFIEVSSRSYWRVKAFHVLLTAHRTRDWLIKCKIGDYFLASVRSAFCAVELETKAIRKFAKISIVSYSRPSLMIIASASQFHVCLPSVGSTPV